MSSTACLADGPVAGIVIAVLIMTCLPYCMLAFFWRRWRDENKELQKELEQPAAAAKTGSDATAFAVDNPMTQQPVSAASVTIAMPGAAEASAHTAEAPAAAAAAPAADAADPPKHRAAFKHIQIFNQS